MDYTETLLWKSAFSESNGVPPNITQDLVREYKMMREKVSSMLKKIHDDFPRLTLHDISHADKLWETGSIITGSDYPVNAYEGFILGGAFLLHDAALSFDAVNGKEELRSTETWKDYAALCRKNKWVEERFVEDEADFYTIRKFHADRAESLASEEILFEDGIKGYIIQNEYFRKYLGPIIGDIAASHHWSIDRLQKLDPYYTFDGCNINNQKLACILRCADAAHIDVSRAPDSFFNVLRLNHVSYAHWCAQNRLSLIAKDPSKQGFLMIKSAIPFSEEDFDAWNVAYDAACMIDREIKGSNLLLANSSCRSFYAKGISGVESREAFSNYVKAKDWAPSDCEVHISKIADLISSLGGTKLYGKNNQLMIVLRELIQNARDAVVARRELEKNSLAYKGRILVQFEKSGEDVLCSVSDNGVGMSKRTITTSFLDFGSSFWSSSESLSEFPSLHSSGFSSIGQYGIGFYSVFMVADEVFVNSRRFDEGIDSNTELKFLKGLSLTPIVRRNRDVSTIYSTTVRFKIKKGVTGIHEWENGTVIDDNQRAPFWIQLARLTSGLDVEVFYASSIDPNEIRVHQSIDDPDFDKKKWFQDILYSEYLDNPVIKEYVEENYDKLEMIRMGSKVVGLATLALPPEDICKQSGRYRLKTIGGLLSVDESYDGYVYVGFLDFQPNSIKRDTSSEPVSFGKPLTQWAISQKQLILASKPFRSQDSLISRFLPVLLGQYNVNSYDFAQVYLFDPDTQTEHRYGLDEVYHLMLAGKRIVYPKKGNRGQQPFESPYEETRDYLVIRPQATFYSSFHIDKYSSYSSLTHIYKFAEKKGSQVRHDDLGLFSYDEGGERFFYPAFCMGIAHGLDSLNETETDCTVGDINN